MKDHLFITASHKSCNILHITDTHLFADVSSELLGINTYDSFLSTLDTIISTGKRYDLIVATGDFVQDHSEKGYMHFAKEISRLSIPCVWLQGNHDDPLIMERVFQRSSLSANKTVLLGDSWLVLMLNSQVIKQPFGELSKPQLSWLDQQLSLYANRHVLVALHHHFLPVGCDWLDVHKLKNSEAFQYILNKHHNVNAIICGHIHQEVDRLWKNIRWLSTPSTCIQFRPNSKRFALDIAQPGWRNIELLPNGTIITTANYLPENLFNSDMTQEGY